jgi:3-dehydrosphinganine reductase
MWLLALLLALPVAALVSFVLQRRRKPVGFSEQHVVVTGGSEGLGLAVAELLAARGAHVTLVARSEARLETARASVDSRRLRTTQRVATVACDVGDAAALEAALRRLPAVDLLVANAGMSIPKLFSDLTDGELRAMMQVNFFGSANAARAVLPGMVRAGRGRIVFVASAMSLTAMAGYSGYCGGKWGVRGMAECLHSELSPSGVGVHIFYAPTMKTRGLETENLVKPKVTHELEAVGDTVTAGEAAAALLAGVDAGRFEITGDLGAELLAMASLGSPYGNTALRLLLSPLLVLLTAGWRWYTRRVANKHLRKQK